MKRAFQNTILCTLALMALASCSGVDEFDGGEPGVGEYTINLSVFCQAPETKADAAGVAAYNENKLDYVDWFVFKSDADTDDALVSGRDNPSGAANTVKTLSLESWVRSLDRRNFYVYAVANYPTTLVADHDAMPKTLTGLKALSHTASFNHQDVFSNEGLQASFIMRGGQVVSWADNERGTKAVDVPLKRLAGKVSVDLKVAPAIDELKTLPDGSQQYIQTWYPDVEHIEVYLSFANASSTLEGTPAEYNMTDFFTYYRSGFEATIPVTAPSWDGGAKWEITGTPFYSYPMTWDSESPQAPFLKVILKWKAYDESKGGTVSPVTTPSDDGPKFVRHQRDGYVVTDTTDPYLKSDPADLPEFYYKIPLVPMSEETGTLAANDWYIINADLSILGSTSDDLPVILGGQYYVTDWGTGMASTGELKQASYLSLDRYNYEIYAQDEITIPVHSSHDLDHYTVTSATYTDYHDLTPALNQTLSTLNTTTHQLSSPDEIRFNGNQSFTLKHVLNTDFTSSGLECARITYVFTVTNKAGIESQPITVVQYPPIFIERIVSNKYVFINGETNHYDIDADPWADRFKSQAAHPIYDDGDEDYPYSLSVDNSTLTSASDSYTDSRGVHVEFDTTNDGNYKKPQEGHQEVTITAPAPYYVYKLELELITSTGSNYGTYNAGSNYGITYTADYKSFNQSSNKVWYGEARNLLLHFNSGSLGARIKSITVHYHNSNLLGTIAHHENSTGANANGNMYIISATDVSQLGFFVADTRSATAVDYPKLHEGGGTGTTSLTGYYPLNSIPYNNNAIAPKFMVASTFGGSFASGMRFESAVERCASYQENGYPAGRWRLPTDAEIKFIARLSANGKIPSLFDGTYWGSSGIDGKAIYVSGGTYTETSGNAVASVRCIYPLWYWGEEQMYDPAPNDTRPLTTWKGWQNN